MLTVALTYPEVSLVSVLDNVQCNLPSQSQSKAWNGWPIYHLQFSLQGHATNVSFLLTVQFLSCPSRHQSILWLTNVCSSLPYTHACEGQQCYLKPVWTLCSQAWERQPYQTQQSPADIERLHCLNSVISAFLTILLPLLHLCCGISPPCSCSLALLLHPDGMGRWIRKKS